MRSPVPSLRVKDIEGPPPRPKSTLSANSPRCSGASPVKFTISTSSPYLARCLRCSDINWGEDPSCTDCFANANVIGGRGQWRKNGGVTSQIRATHKADKGRCRVWQDER